MKGIEPSIAFMCIYQIQSRGETVNIRHLLEEANKYQSLVRECIVCMSNYTNSLFLPCRFVFELFSNLIYLPFKLLL